MAKELGLKNLHTVHRLDRLTSGLLLFARNPSKAKEMAQQIRSRVVQKEYFCRVEGNFPNESITCQEPIEIASEKIGVCIVSSKGKDCTTSFQKLGYNGQTSLVLCKPKTGRMHQIRVHLQFLGHPIGKKHASNKYEQFVLNTKLLLLHYKCDFHKNTFFQFLK